MPNMYAVAYDEHIIPKHWNATGNAITGGDYDQRAYSKVAEVGPEVLDTGQALPSLPPTPLPISQEPLGWWKLDETSGVTAADASPNKNPGMLINGPAWGTGKFGGALSLDGVDDYVEVQYDFNEVDVVQGMTVAGWVQARSFRVGGSETWFKKGTGSVSLGMTSGLDPGKASGGLTVGGRSIGVHGTTLLSPNTWYHIALTYNGSEAALYVNGIQEGKASTTGKLDSGGTLLIDHGSTVDRFWNGLVDDVRIYNRALSAAEISQIMLPPVTPTMPTPTIAIGDLNGDGRVDINDVSFLLTRWGRTDFTSLQEADISTGTNNISSGKIDIYDANKLMANWTG